MQNRAEQSCSAASVLRAIRSTDIAYNAVSQAKKTYQCYPDVVQLSTETGLQHTSSYKSYLLTMLSGQ
jgi:hypothetical protein